MREGETLVFSPFAVVFRLAFAKPAIKAAGKPGHRMANAEDDLVARRHIWQIFLVAPQRYIVFGADRLQSGMNSAAAGFSDMKKMSFYPLK